MSSELNPRWLDEVSGKENLLNLVITKKGRLTGLTGVFTRLHPGRGNRDMLEISAQDYFKTLKHCFGQ